MGIQYSYATRWWEEKTTEMKSVCKYPLFLLRYLITGYRRHAAKCQVMIAFNSIDPIRFPMVSGILCSINGIVTKETELNSQLWEKITKNIKELKVLPMATNTKSAASPPVCHLNYALTTSNVE